MGLAAGKNVGISASANAVEPPPHHPKGAIEGESTDVNKAIEMNTTQSEDTLGERLACPKNCFPGSGKDVGTSAGADAVEPPPHHPKGAVEGQTLMNEMIEGPATCWAQSGATE